MIAHLCKPRLGPSPAISSLDDQIWDFGDNEDNAFGSNIWCI